MAEIDGPDNGECRNPMHIGEPDARWIACMSPVVAEPLSRWLEAEADTLDCWFRVAEYGQPYPDPSREAAIALARAVLGGQS